MRALILAVPFIAAASSPASKPMVTFEPGPGRGEAIYRTYCHHCHGEAADGRGHMGRGLPVKPADLTSAEVAPRINERDVFKTVRDGMQTRGGSLFMIAWRDVLGDDQIRDVSAYTVKLVEQSRKKRP